ncbi:MAG TPA: UDP-2,3-diacylglucosamine diphosphatase [Noviherbaspirillum sp.]
MHQDPSDLIAKAQSEAIALFVSDVHLQPALPLTTEAFITFLRENASKATRLYILGDLFEYWAGDDDLVTPYNRQICDELRKVNEAGVALFWVAGNRDFLVGDAFASESGLTLLPDPSVIDIAHQRVVLTHGDAQCTDDHAYMAFRAQVRQADWQRHFLAMPLAQRKAIIDGMRTGSREAQRGKSYEIMDVNAEAIVTLFASTDAPVMIHGHTHRPATHHIKLNGKERTRYVLPDWDCDGKSMRGGWLSFDADGAFHRFNADGSPCLAE